MELDEAALAQKHELVKLKIVGSTQISKATATIICKLAESPSDDKSTIVVLTAKARYANKLISIVEIAKRETAANGTKYFQYNALSSEMIEVARESEKSGEKAGDESDDAFETMGAPKLAGTKKRAVPIMTTYLSTTSVRELKSAYG